ncbi:MAG: PilZ domain-containing protein [Myxococcota bacterium]
MSEAYRVLGTTFDSAAALEREWNANLAKGGVFVPGRFELLHREPVLVFVDLPFAGKALDLEGRVVHCVPPEFEERGGRVGVAVELRETPGELSTRIESLLGLRFEAESERGGAEGRAAPRAVAHVRARVTAPGHDPIEGRTRNLSLAGVLIAVPGEAPPVGEKVLVTIGHATSGEERTLPGVIARHELDDRGGISGIGIRFEFEGPEARECEAFVSRIKASEHARRLGAITGSLDTLGLDELLTSFGQCVPRGRFTLVRGGQVGTAQVEGGRLQSAQLGACVGIKALVRLLAWDTGEFEFHPNGPAEAAGAPLGLPIEVALLEAARILDEDRLSPRRRLDPTRRVAIVPETLPGAAGPSKLEQQILDLAGSGTPVSRLLDGIAETDARIEDTLLDLVERGLLHLETAASTV